MLNSTEHEIADAHDRLINDQIKIFHALKLSDIIFILLIHVEMPTIFGIFTFLSRINFKFS